MTETQIATLQITAENNPDHPHHAIIPFVYLHGEAEREFGYDLFVVVSGVWPAQDGLHDAVFLDRDGDERKATVFVWRTNGVGFQRGLVVLDEDLQAWCYSYGRYAERSLSL